MLDGSDAVSMFESALNHPGGRLEPRVRVSRNHHAFLLMGWPEVVGKGPRANHAFARVRKRSTNLDSGSGRELHITRLEEHFLTLFGLVAVMERLEGVVGNLTEAPILVVLHRLNYASLVVHHEWTIGNHWFLDWLPTKQENFQGVVT
jgi:hypothetical protein